MREFHYFPLHPVGKVPEPGDRTGLILCYQIALDILFLLVAAMIAGKGDTTQVGGDLNFDHARCFKNMVGVIKI